jgi:hypothetical protein
VIDTVRLAEAVGQHQGVLHRHTASLSHVWRAGVSGVPNQHHAAAIPLVELDPFNRPNVDLFIRLQSGEIRRNRPAESHKAASEAFEASHERVLETVPVDGSKTIGVALAHWDHSEKASLAQENHYFDYPSRPCWYDAPPDHLPSVAG